MLSILKEEFTEIESQFVIEVNSRKRFSYDIRYKNKIIEYNGIFWHASPLFYNSDDILSYHGKKMTAAEVWKRDEEKINLAKEYGFDVLIVWEYEFKNNKKETIERCKEFLRG